MQGHRIHIIVGSVLACVLLLALVALLRPAQPVVISPGGTDTASRPGSKEASRTDNRFSPSNGSLPDTAAPPGTRIVAGSDNPVASGESAVPGLPGSSSGMDQRGVGSSDSPTTPGLGLEPILPSVTLPGQAFDDSGELASSAGSSKGQPGAEAGRSSLSGTESGSESSGGVAEAGATPTPAPGEAVLGGRVVRGDKPVPEALLSLVGGSGVSLQASTNTEGYYGFPPLKAGRYRVSLVHPQSPTPTRLIDLAEDEQRLDVDFSIPVGPAVPGRVVEYGTGDAIAKASIVIQTDSGRHVTLVQSRGDGSFLTPPLEPGTYQFKTEASGYQSDTQEVFVEETEENTAPPVEITLVPANQIQGRVVDAAGAPVSRAWVALFSLGGASSWTDPLRAVPSAMANGSGQYTITSLSAVEIPFRVGAWREGYLPAYGPALQLPEAAEQEAPPITLSAGVSVTGRVVDSAGDPLEGILVAVHDRSSFPMTGGILERFNASPPSTKTRPDGTFRLQGLEEANVQVDITAEGYRPERKDFFAERPEVDLGEVTLKTIEEAEEGTIFGQVIDEVGATYALAECHLVCLDCSPPIADRHVRSDSDGNFIFEKLPQGTYRLEVTGSTLRENGIWIPVHQKIRGLRPGESFLPVLFDLAGRVRLKVVDEKGEPVSRFRVQVFSRGSWPGAAPGEPYEMTAGTYETLIEADSGETVIKHLVTGRADITVTVEGFGTRSVKDVPVPYDSLGDAGTVVISRGATITGRAVDQATNQPVAGLTVEAVELSSVKTTTRSDGTFVLGPLPSGTYRVRVSGGNWVAQTSGVVSVEGTQSEDIGVLEVQEGGILGGRVLMPNGNPAPSGLIVRVDSVYTTTDAQGRFNLQGVPPGTRTLRATGPSGLAAEIPVDVVAGAIRDDIALQLH